MRPLKFPMLFRRAVEEGVGGEPGGDSHIQYFQNCRWMVLWQIELCLDLQKIGMHWMLSVDEEAKLP